MKAVAGAVRSERKDQIIRRRGFDPHQQRCALSERASQLTVAAPVAVGEDRHVFAGYEPAVQELEIAVADVAAAPEAEAKSAECNGNTNGLDQLLCPIDTTEARALLGMGAISAPRLTFEKPSLAHPSPTAAS